MIGMLFSALLITYLWTVDVRTSWKFPAVSVAGCGEKIQRGSEGVVGGRALDSL